MSSHDKVQRMLMTEQHNCHHHPQDGDGFNMSSVRTTRLANSGWHVTGEARWDRSDEN